MKYVCLIIFSCLIIISCSADKEQGEDSALNKKTSSVKQSKADVELKGQLYPIRLDEEIIGEGVLSLKGQDPYTERTTEVIEILNLDGSIHSKINLTENNIVFDNGDVIHSDSSRVLIEDYKFNPKLFYPEYELLEFFVLKVTDTHYYVSIDKDSNRKMIKKNESQFNYNIWEDYIKNKYLSFDSVNNPIRESPEASSEIIYKYNDYFFEVIEVNGDWVKIECSDACKACDNGNLSGWIKWREGKKLLIKTATIC